MKYLFYTILFPFISSCDNKPSKVIEPVSGNNPKIDLQLVDSALTFQYQTNFTDRNITNKSDRKIDLLFNGIDGYFGGHEYSKIGFHTECMLCQPVQEYNGGLLFGKRLLITPTHIEYYKTNFGIPDSSNRLKLISDFRERTNPKFNFQDGKGSIKYIGISCNDADFNKVRLTFPTGEVVVDSLINASFFEYDLDADGQYEQYLIGVRNCSQELVILRTRK